jgi:hypothetical protein
VFSAVSLADLMQPEALYRKLMLTTNTTCHFSIVCFVLFPAQGRHCVQRSEPGRPKAA